MRKWWLVLFWCLGSLSLIAQEPARLDTLRPQGFVNDYARVLSPETAQNLEALLRELDQKTRAQLAIVTLPSLEGEEMQDFSNRLFEKWGVGHRGEDKGVLLVMSVAERQVRIEVGYGLEGLLPDAKTGRILDQYVLPWFRQGDYGRGLADAAQAIAALIATDAGITLTGTSAPTATLRGRPLSCGEMVLGLIILIILIPILIKHPWLLLLLLNSGVGRGGGGFGRGGFGGFGGGLSGGGGAGRSW